jgi:hypothetical protein
MEQEEKNEVAEKINVTRIYLKQLFFWIGVIVCLLSLFAFFASTDWLKSSLDFKDNDSDASSLLNEVASYLLTFALKLKNLPIWFKIAGALGGGAIALFTYKDDGEAK